MSQPMLSCIRWWLLALFSAGRVSNLPSVISNVTCGGVMGAVASGGGLSWRVSFAVVASAAFLYLFGCFLNLLWDEEWDRVHRPERLRSEFRVSRPVLTVFSVICPLLSFLLIVNLGSQVLLMVGVAATLLFCIIFYTWIHKKTFWAFVPMALCRCLLYPLGFVSQGGELLRPLVFLLVGFALMFAYVSVISLIARRESGSARLRNVVGKLLMCIPLVDFVLMAGLFGLGFMGGEENFGLASPWLVLFVPLICIGLGYVLRRSFPAT